MNLRLLCCKLTVGFHFVARNQALLFFCMFRTVPAMAPFRRHVSCQVNHGAIWHCFEYTNTQGHTSGNEYLCICTYCTYVCRYIYIHMHIYMVPPSMSVSYRFWRFDGTAKSILSMTFSMTVASGTSASLAIAAFQIIRTASPYWTLSNPNVLKKFLGKTLPESHCGGLLGV